MVPGAPMDDAPVQVAGQDAWLLDQVGNRFACLLFADAVPSAEVLAQLNALQAPRESAPPRANVPPVPVTPLIVAPRAFEVPGVKVLVDTQGWVAKRYDGQDGTTYLLRPDQHVAARWRQLDSAKVQQALVLATCQADALL